MLLLQLWLIPGLRLANSVLAVNGTSVTLREVKFDILRTNITFPTILLEMDSDIADLKDVKIDAFRPLSLVVERLSFLFLRPFSAVAGRVLPKNLQVGDRYESFEYRLGPPGVNAPALTNATGMASTFTGLDLDFLVGHLSPEVEGAMSSFMAGLHDVNIVRKAMCYWVGLEMLAPEIKGLVRCGSCGEEIPLCSECGNATTGPKATKTVTEYLTRQLGVTRKEAKELYQVRNEIAHGRIAMDPSSLERMTKPAFRLQELLLQGIRSAMNRPSDRPPLIQHTGTVQSFQMTVPGTFKGGDLYDLPVNRHPIEIQTWSGRSVL